MKANCVWMGQRSGGALDDWNIQSSAAGAKLKLP